MTISDGAIARNRGIDALRGLSIVLVVVHHVGLRIPLETSALASVVPRRVLSALIHNGYEAVFIFFVVSGFLITANTLRRWQRLGAVDIGAFYARRFARIAPSLLALVLALSVLHLAGAKDYVITHENQSLPRAIVAALALHLNWYEGHTGYLPGNWDVLWSLSIEEVFYLGFPIVCLTLWRQRVLVPALALLALSLPVTRAALAANEIWQEKAYLPGMAAIATGVLGALAARRFSSPPLGLIAALGLVGVIGLGAVLFVEDWLWQVLGNGTMLVLTGSAVTLVIACAWWEADGPRALPGMGWLRSFGRLSYEIYLTHMFVVWTVLRAFRAAGGGVRFGFFWYVPMVALSWVLGALVERCLSTPCERALRRRLLRSSAPVAMAAG